MKKMKVNSVLSYTGACIAFCIGSGFATGQEIMQFFSSFGILGSIGASIIATLLFILCTRKLFEVGRLMKFKSPNLVFRYYCGDFIGSLFQYFTPVYLFMMLVMMISGAGATLNEYYGVNPYIGRTLMAFICLITVTQGLNNLVNILGQIGPVIIIMIISLGVVSVWNNTDGLISSDNLIATVQIHKATSTWWMSGILYVAYNIVGMTPFLTEMGASSKSSKNTRMIGILTGLLLGITIIVMNFGMLSVLKDVYSLDVPSLYMANEISSVVGIVFSAIIMAGIYTTSVPILWSVCNTFSYDESSAKFKIVAAVIVLAALVFARIPFGTLVGTVYPYTGYAGILLMVALLLKPNPVKC